MTITKTHIINAIADQIGFSGNHSSEIVETLLEVIKKPSNLARISRSADSASFVSKTSGSEKVGIPRRVTI